MPGNPGESCEPFLIAHIGETMGELLRESKSHGRHFEEFRGGDAAVRTEGSVGVSLDDFAFLCGEDICGKPGIAGNVAEGTLEIEYEGNVGGAQKHLCRFGAGDGQMSPEGQIGESIHDATVKEMDDCMTGKSMRIDVGEGRS